MRKYPARSAEPYLGAFAIFVTFFLVGIWHGQTSEFVFFGVLQGGGVAGVQLYQTTMNRRLGKKRYKALGANALYHDVARGLTFTWFAFTLLWFWSNWTKIGDIAKQLGPLGAACVFFAILVASTVVLSAWEATRRFFLKIEVKGEPVMVSRYTRTVWDTAMAVVALATVMLMNAPAPEIVYKAF